jgi:hypothetical protein
MIFAFDPTELLLWHDKDRYSVRAANLPAERAMANPYAVNIAINFITSSTTKTAPVQFCHNRISLNSGYHGHGLWPHQHPCPSIKSFFASFCSQKEVLPYGSKP